MKKLLAIVALSLVAAAAFAETQGTPIDGFAAEVNGRVITVSEVLGILIPVREQLESRYSGAELEAKVDEAYKTVLDSLIERALILEEFAKIGGNIPDRAVDEQINSFISERFDNDRAAFLEALTTERMTLDEWRDEMKNRLVVTLMRRKEVADRVLIPPRQIREVYESRLNEYRLPEQIKLRMIVLHKGSGSKDQAAKRAEAEEIRAKLTAGTDFADLAKSASEGPKAAEGGDIGWVEPKDLREEIGAAARKMEIGQVSDVIDAGEDYYLIKVEGRKEASVKPFDEMRADIEKELRQAEELRLYKDWIERLKKKYYVKIYET